MMAPPASNSSSAAAALTVVQDPREAEYPSMPETALRNVDIDYVVPLNMMAALLDEITRGPVPEGKSTIP